MKHLMRAALALTLVLTGAPMAQANAPCDAADPALSAAARDVLAQAGDPQVAAWAIYLNDRFFDDLACALPSTTTPQTLRDLGGGAGGLLELVQAQAMTRNQSDALMMILSAMQDTRTED